MIKNYKICRERGGKYKDKFFICMNRIDGIYDIKLGDNSMYLYIFKHNFFIDSVYIINHTNYEIRQQIKELKDKHGDDVQILLSDEYYYEPFINGVKQVRLEDNKLVHGEIAE